MKFGIYGEEYSINEYAFDQKKVAGL